MTPEKIEKICEEYRALIRRNVAPDIAPRRLSENLSRVHYTDLYYEYPLAHLLWMCDEIPNLVRAGRVEKAMRWLGFLQGACWAASLETLDDAKRWNTPDGETFDGGRK